ncbi:MAG: FCD domain-containing protein [Actinomycetota bacterium]|nr:FCD domain-containing protein [Actinomycetota bacterium]
MTIDHRPRAENATVTQFLDEQRRLGALTDGAKLPTERELANLLGCTRHDVRRQLDVLEKQGRVTRQVGRGTFLSQTGSGQTYPQAAGPLLAPTGLSPLDLIDARVAWEPNLMTLVVITATSEDFDEIRRCLGHGDEARTAEEFVVWDMAFHRALAMSTHNAVVSVLTDMVEDGRRQLAGSALDHRRYSVENCAVCQREHREIADAVFDRDGARAHAAMRSHLETVRGQLLSDLP